MARTALFSPSVLSYAASGHRLPSLQVTLAFVQTCGGDSAAWERRWRRLSDGEQPPTRKPATTPASLPRPAQLPLPGRLVGREADLRLLDEAVAEPVLITGAAGVGKSELALHHAHALASTMVEGQLYADLGLLEQGHRDVEDVLDGFLRALGVPIAYLPSTPDQRAGLYRSLLAERRLVVLLDNAPDERSVRALLTRSPRSATIVVSRFPLLGLHHVHRIHLDVLPRPDSIAMLMARTAGQHDLDRLTCDRLAELCGDLPLALDIAGRKLAARPEVDPRAVVRKLAEPGYLLRWLRIGDLSVQEVLASVYAGLSEPARTLLGHLTPRTRGECTPATAGDEDELEELTEAGMLRPGRNPGSYRLDGLVHALVNQEKALTATRWLIPESRRDTPAPVG
jgi:hypothetical protein